MQDIWREGVGWDYDASRKIQNTFKEAASRRMLLESDSEWENCLNEAATF